MDLNLRIPWGYYTATRTLGEARNELLKHYHPEYVRRLIAWLHSKGGTIGIGSTWRADGTQPNDPGFAPEGKSFHQNQKYNDGFIGATAVDVVAANPGHRHRTVRWDEVPKQGGTEATRWGVHANVDQGASAEPWHIQPIEIDGWTSWRNAGSPAPRANYPLPGGATTPPPTPPPPTTGATYTVASGDSWYRMSYKLGVRAQRLAAANGLTLQSMIHPGQVLKVPAPERSYTVKPNDGWWSVAKGLGKSTNSTTYDQLKLQLSHKYRRTTLYAGDVLTA